MKKYVLAAIMTAAALTIAGCATGQVGGVEVEPVESSAIKNVGYDAAASTLIITFDNGQAYKFFDVPADVHEELKSAKSKGTYFNSKVNGTYTYEVIQ